MMTGMTSEAAPRLPGTLRFIAWSWIALGALTALLLWVGAHSAEAMRATFAASSLATAPGFARLLDTATRPGWGLALQAAFAAACLAGGIGLLLRRAWSRALCEALSWLSLAFTAGFALLWMQLWQAVTAELAGGDPGWLLWSVGLAIDLVVSLAAALPLWLFIRALRGPKARAALR